MNVITLCDSTGKREKTGAIANEGKSESVLKAGRRLMGQRVEAMKANPYRGAGKMYSQSPHSIMTWRPVVGYRIAVALTRYLTDLYLFTLISGITQRYHVHD